MMSKIFAVSNYKGGVGKTTSTINLGAALAYKKRKVLLIDLDPQANLTISLGITDVKISIYENLRGKSNVEPIKYKNNLSILPSSLDLSAAEIELSSEPGREYILKEIIKKLQREFDYIFIDCPPSLGLLTINALTASQYVIIPMQAEYLPLRGLAKLTEVIEKIQKRLNNKLQIGGVFFTQYDARKILNKDIADSVSAFFLEKLFETKISNNIALAEAPSQGKDIFSYNKNCKGAVDYNTLCEEMIKRGLF